MKHLGFLFAILTISHLISCVDTVVPSGTLISKDYPLLSLHTISIESGFSAYIISDSLPSMLIEADNTYMPYVEVINTNDGRLRIRRRAGINFSNNRDVKIYISVNQLHQFSLSGGGYAKMDNLHSGRELSISMSGGSESEINHLSVEELDLDVSGGSKVSLGVGDIDHLELELSGGSQLNAFPIIFDDIDAELSGGSQAFVSVAKWVELSASGGSRFSYRGTPEFRKTELSGGSTIHQQ